MKTTAVLLLFALLSGLEPVAAQGSGSATPPPPVSFSGLFYLAYQNGKQAGANYSRFSVNRAYVTAQAKMLPKLSSRVTMDAYQNSVGDMEVRLKYAYAKYAFAPKGSLRDLGLEGGLVHTPWLDFEEHVNPYRMSDGMYMERSGLFNSADFGVTLMGSFGPSLGDEYRKKVSSSNAGRWGSFALGAYNGGGYHGVEGNADKTAQGRLTIRPLPDRLPGFQVSGLAVAGKGNKSGKREKLPDWRNYALFASYQHARGTLTAQHVWGEGNQKGSWTEPGDPTRATDIAGSSVFAELKLDGGWRVIGGYDRFERTPGATDQSFDRAHAGVAHDLGGQNVLLFDWARVTWDDARPNDTRLQVVMQVTF